MLVVHARRSRWPRAREAAFATLMGLLLLHSPPAAAESPLPIEIGWQAPAVCPQEIDLRKRIQNLLGSRRPTSPLLAEGTIVRISRGFRLQLKVQLGSLQETRIFESISCDDLVGAAAVEVGLLIQSAEMSADRSQDQPRSLSQPPASEPAPSTSRSTEKPQNPQVDTETPRPKEEAAAAKKDKESDSSKDEASGVKETGPQRAWHVLVQAPFAALQTDSQARLNVGGGLSLGLEYAKWQWQLEATLWKRQRVPAKNLPVYGADIDRISTNLWACREFRFSWFGLSPCLTAGVERLSARGTGRGIAPSPRQSIGMAAGAGGQGRLHMASWLSLLMTVGGHVNFSRPEVSIDGVGFVYRLSPAALYASLGLEWIL